MTPLDEGTCRGCGRPILWTVTRHGKRTPLDPQLLTVMTEAGAIEKGRTSHFATCPQASMFRARPVAS